MNNLLRAVKTRGDNARRAANTNFAVLAAISGTTRDRNNVPTLSR